MNRLFALALTMVLILSLAACGKNENTASYASSVSISSAAPSEEASMSSHSSSVSSTTSANVSANTSGSTQDILDTEMNLTQIQAGNYSSLLGTWIEVAYSYNLFDGSGQQWQASTSDTVPSTLSVSTDKIVFNDSAMVMQGNTITDEAGSHLLEFVNSEGSLYADLADAHTTIFWSVTFYPKGIANDIEPNNGVKIDNTKNLIDIWYSGMQHEIIFAQT